MKLQLKVLISIFLIIGTFLASQNFIYSQTTQDKEKNVGLLSHKMESGGEGLVKFIGQVHNMINKNVVYVTIIGTFYDASGKMIGSKSRYSEPSNLKPNMTAPFEMLLDENISKNIASYDVTITWRYPGESEKHSNVYGLNQ
jgi:hypothetical protein